MTRSALTAVAALLVLTACGSTKTPSAAPSFDTAAGTPSAAAGASAKASPTGGGTTSSPKPATSTGSGQSGPAIEYFRIKTKPSCPSSGPGASFPGNDIVLEWKVTGGPTQVTVSIDSPGIFGTYDATSTQAFPFACSGPSNSTQKHTYLLKTVGGTVKQATLTGEAHVN